MHPAYKYDPTNRDFPSPEDEAQEERHQTIEFLVFMGVILLAVIGAAIGLVSFVKHLVTP